MSYFAACGAIKCTCRRWLV